MSMLFARQPRPNYLDVHELRAKIGFGRDPARENLVSKSRCVVVDVVNSYDHL